MYIIEYPFYYSNRLWALRPTAKTTSTTLNNLAHSLLTTSISTTALADSLPSSVPKLDPSGQNWAIFSVRFQDAVEASRRKDFGAISMDPSPVQPCCHLLQPPAAEAQWMKDERSAKSLLTQKIPNDTGIVAICNL